VRLDADDARARLLAQTLNRTRGKDDPKAYAQLLDQVLRELEVVEVTSLLPETEATLDQVLRELDGEPLPEPVWALPAQPRPQLGAVYRLGPHRLFCGDATNPEHVASLLNGLDVELTATDPPYGVRLNQNERGPVRARQAPLLNDDRAEWAEALLLARA